MVALTEIMLDPYLRTRRGLAIVIQKEWISFGHKFAVRIGHAKQDLNDSERSPIFLQFLDCVYQLTQLFPSSFEFNDDYLTYICQHIFSCKFGTFLHNCEKEYKKYNTMQNTASIWNQAIHNDRFINPLYRPKRATGGGSKDDVLIPNVDMRSLRVWPFYYRCDKNIPRDMPSITTMRELLLLERGLAREKQQWLEEKLDSIVTENLSLKQLLFNQTRSPTPPGLAGTGSTSTTTILPPSREKKLPHTSPDPGPSLTVNSAMPISASLDSLNHLVTPTRRSSQVIPFLPFHAFGFFVYRHCSSFR